MSLKSQLRDRDLALIEIAMTIHKTAQARQGHQYDPPSPFRLMTQNEAYCYSLVLKTIGVQTWSQLMDQKTELKKGKP